MGLKDLFSTDTDSALPPENRLDESIRELGKYYVAEGKNRISVAPADSESEEKAIEPTDDLDLLQKIRSMLLDTSTKAKHAVDILNDESLLETEGTEDLFKILFEPTFGATKLNLSSEIDSSSLTSNAGIMSQCAAANIPAADDSKTGEQGTYEVTYPDHGNSSPVPDALKDPHLSAILVTHPSIHPAQSRNIAGSIFFNSIPGIEMSQCAPFIRLSFQSDFEVASGMTLQGFAAGNISNARPPSADATGLNFDNFRIEPETSEIGAEIAGGLTGIAGNLASALGAESGDEFEIENDRTYSSGIELFQAPQTLNALGGSSTGGRTGKEGNGLFSTSVPGPHRQLNPAAPIATLVSLNVSITGLGIAALANKTAQLDFIIHDRSFMRFLSPLIGGSNFQGTSVTVEYGWMHPQSTDTSEGNVYANFLNSLRSKSTFNIQVSNTSLGNDGQVRVSLKLASRGASDLVTVPAGSGVTHIPAVALSPMFSRIVKQILKTKSRELTSIGDEDRLEDISQGYTAMASFKGPTDLIPVKEYKELLLGIKDASGKDQESQGKVLEAAVTQINAILQKREEATETTKFNTLTQGLEAKRLRLEQIDIFSEGDGKVTPLTQQVGEKEKNEGGESESQSNSESPDVVAGSSYPTLGSVIATYIGRPMQALGKFDEVQLIFYPFNTLAGTMHSYNVASFTLDGFEQFITDISTNNPAISCKTFLEELFSSSYAGGPSNPAHVNYGLSDYYKDLKSNLEDAGSGEAKKAVLADAEGKKVEKLDSIYDNPKKPNEFVPPDVTVYMESVPSEFKEDKTIRDTTILRIHVYDAKAGLKNSTLLLNQLNISPITTSSKPSADESIPESAKKAREFADAEQQGIDDLVESPAAIKQQDLGADEDGNIKTLLFTELTMNELKAALKSVHPSITFGTQFTNVKSVAVNSNTGGAVNQVLLVNAVKENRDATSSQSSSGLEDVFIIPASINMQTEGFPLVEYGQKYFIDFGTGTTMDNFYYVTGLSHSLTPGTFTTNIQFSYNGSATRKAIVSELKRTIDVNS